MARYRHSSTCWKQLVKTEGDDTTAAISKAARKLSGSSALPFRGTRSPGKRTSQGHQSDSSLAIVNQSPMRCALVAQPKVLHQSLPLPGTHKRWRNRFAGLGDAISLHQEKLALS